MLMGSVQKVIYFMRILKIGCQKHINHEVDIFYIKLKIVYKLDQHGKYYTYSTT